MEEMINLVSFILGLLTFALGVCDVLWHYRYTFIPSVQPRWRQMLFYSSTFALFNGMSAILLKANATLQNLMLVCRAIWIMHLLQSFLAVFNHEGLSGRDENIKAAGEKLDAADMSPVRIKPIIFGCCASGGFNFKPNTDWLKASIARAEFFAYGSICLAVVLEVLDKYELLYKYHGDGCSFERPCAKHLSLVQTVGTMVIIIVGLSGILPIKQVISELILPGENHKLIDLRVGLFNFFMPYHAFIQNTILRKILELTIGVHTTHLSLAFVTAIEMLIFQILSHRGLVPMFTFRFPAPPPPPQEIIDKIRSGIKFSLDVEEMAALHRANPKEDPKTTV